MQRKADNFLAIDILQKGEGAKKIKEKDHNSKIEHSSKHNPKHKMIWIESYPSKGPKWLFGVSLRNQSPEAMARKIKTIRGPTVTNLE